MDINANSSRDLSTTVESLTAALVASESRHRSLERMFRWGGIAFVAFAAVVFYVGFDLMGKAHAVAGLNTNDQSVAQSLANIDGTLQQMAQGMGSVIQGGEQMIQQLQPSIMDAATLVARLKEDSDYWRAHSAEKHTSIAHELAQVSAALRAVPVMAAEMQRMNVHMQAMSYSVGSTMGRAGSWMPW